VLLTAAVLRGCGRIRRCEDAIPQPNLLFKRHGHSSGAQAPAFGSGQPRRARPRSCLSPVCARSKDIANHALVAADRRLNFGPQIIAAGLLPGHAAAFGDHPQMAVALCRGGFGRNVRHRARLRRNDDGSVWITLGNRLADPVLVVGAIGGNVMGSAIWPRSVSTIAASSISFLVTSTATISPLSASTPICSLRQDRRRDVPGGPSLGAAGAGRRSRQSSQRSWSR
jgi:hypothetical protein